MANDENIKGHKWKKGQSGNPKGRPKGTPNFKTNLKKALQLKADDGDYFTPLVIKLLKLMSAENEQVSLKATLEMVDRLEATKEEPKMDIDTSKLSKTEIDILLKLLKKAESDSD